MVIPFLQPRPTSTRSWPKPNAALKRVAPPNTGLGNKLQWLAAVAPERLVEIEIYADILIYRARSR